MGSRALQLISGMISIVVIRARRLSMVRVAMIAGIEQPKPSSMGMKLLPWSPTLFMTRSMTNAARAM
jgi:hypothetical protein